MFSARLRHRWRNVGGNVTNVLFLLSGFAEGERPTPMHMMHHDGVKKEK